MITAVIIAIGTGTFAGLGGTTEWRLRSNDASYAKLNYHDLRVRLPDSTDVAQGSLLSAAHSITSSNQLTVAEERLVISTQVDASTAGRTVLVPGEIVGMAEKARVDSLHVVAGRLPVGGSNEALLDSKFAKIRELPETGELLIAGGRRVTYHGIGYSPSYFRVVGGSQQLTGELDFAVLFMPLDTAQQLTGHTARVNDLVLRLAPGSDSGTVATELRVALRDVGATVETRDDDRVRRTLYADARNDEKMWTILSLLILAGASFAAFNLISRMVESERHEIGVGMAIGTPPIRLGLRPFLVGLQIAVLGVVLGVGVGLMAGNAMRQLLVEQMPLPVWITPFPVGRYFQAAIAGIVLPLLATIIPVRRALRVEPVEALRSQSPGSRVHLAALAPLAMRLRFPGHVVAMMPLRNVLRAPRRTLLTALGIAASIVTLVAVLGMLDSIVRTFERSDAEVGRSSPDRLQVALAGFFPADAPQVTAVADSPSVGRAEAGLRLGATMHRGSTEVETVVDLIDFSSAMWTPSISAGAAPIDRTGLVISEKAATDLGVKPGDTITLNHPVRTGLTYRLIDTEMKIAGVHPNPLRFFSYLDTSQADLFNLDGIVDTVLVQPARGSSADDVKRALFQQPGVSSVQAVGVLGETLQQRMAPITGVLRVLEGFSLVLALLIAVNSATLAVEERRREQATMFAFGLPVRTVLRTIVIESALTAMLGTTIGIALGIGALRWLLSMLTTDTLPEVGIDPWLSPWSLATIVILGIGVVAAAPLFAWRRLRNTDIPSTLRVLE